MENNGPQNISNKRTKDKMLIIKQALTLDIKEKAKEYMEKYSHINADSEMEGKMKNRIRMKNHNQQLLKK